MDSAEASSASGVDRLEPGNFERVWDGCAGRPHSPGPHLSPGRLSASKALGFHDVDRDVEDRAGCGQRWSRPSGSFGPGGSGGEVPEGTPTREWVSLHFSPENAAVFSFDEKSQIQALDRTQPGLPMKRGQAGTMTHDYKRHGTTTLFAALEVASGKVIGRTYRKRCSFCQGHHTSVVREDPCDLVDGVVDLTCIPGSAAPSRARAARAALRTSGSPPAATRDS